MFPVAVVYVGLAALGVGLVSLAKPLDFVGIPTRRKAAIVAASGIVLVFAGMSLPAGETQISNPQTRFDTYMPVYQFHEVHSIRVAAPREQVFRAVKEVTPGEIPFFRTLTWIRRLGRPVPESILNAPEGQPILEVATRSSFLRLDEIPGREIVVGTLVVTPQGWQAKSKPTPEGFQMLNASGFALAGMNFYLEDDGPSACVVSTETRVFATDPSTRRRFARYWRVIYPGSALLRRMWLRAIKHRAEATS